MTFPPLNGSPGPPPTTSAPLDSGRIITELTGTSITLGNVAIIDPATGVPYPSVNGGQPVSIVDPSPLPVTFASPTSTHYLAAGVIASLTAAGGTQALPSALATTRIDALSISILPTAALAGQPSLRVELEASGGLVLASGVVSFQNPWVVSFPSGVLVGTAGPLSLVYLANSGSLELDYTITGVSP